MEKEGLLGKLFHEPKPIIGMIHLAGRGYKEKVRRAIEELEIYREEGVNGAIIEDYHGHTDDIIDTLNQISDKALGLVIGVNTLRSPYSSFRIAKQFCAKFVQLDTVLTPQLSVADYEVQRNVHTFCVH